MSTSTIHVGPALGGEPARFGAPRDYLELAKPGITALIVLVAVAAFLGVAPISVAALPRLGALVAFGASASAGAAMLNHYLDRDLDARMKRTRSRPLPASRVTPAAHVAGVGLALSAVGIGGAALLLNPLTGFSILLGSLTYVVVYTAWLKRRSSVNIVVGGFAGSAPALAGAAAALGTWTPGILAVALLVFLWTPPHFWSLALLLREDYRRAGLPMLPYPSDVDRSARTVVVAAALLVPATALVALLTPLAIPLALGMIALGVGFVLLVYPLRHGVDRAVARRGFIFSGPYLLGVLVLLALNPVLVAHGIPAWSVGG